MKMMSLAVGVGEKPEILGVKKTRNLKTPMVETTLERLEKWFYGHLVQCALFELPGARFSF